MILLILHTWHFIGVIALIGIGIFIYELKKAPVIKYSYDEYMPFTKEELKVLKLKEKLAQERRKTHFMKAKTKSMGDRKQKLPN